MTDTFSKQQRSDIMRKVKGKDTSLERRFRSALWRKGLRFRKHTPLIGKPDVVFPRAGVVVFLDSCYWHGCPEHLRIPHSRVRYWRRKIDRNRKRDQHVTQQLEADGWLVLRFWEHDIKEEMEACVDKVARMVKRGGNS